jgi:sucrose-6-phosphate hydrolase SacC (GH32 family)
MKRTMIILQLIAISLLMTSCYDDPVKFVFEGDNLPIAEAFEFKFDESSGTTTTESFTGQSYEILGRGINRMTGASERALFFDGLSNEIPGSVATNLLPSDQFVASLWVSPKSYPVGTAGMIALTSEGSSTGVMIGINQFGQVVVQYFIDGAFAQEVSNESVPRDSWNHLVVGLNPADQDVKIYLNKNLISDGNVPSGDISWPDNNTPLSIGKNTMGEMIGIFDIDYFSGALDEINIYSGLATQEVVDYINSQYNPPPTVEYENDIDYSGDTNRPLYHAVPDIGWANESYGLIYLDNTYHMFFQKNEVFLGIAQQNWGHFTSEDLVRWEEKNAVLWPTQGWDQAGIWTGSTLILNDGTPAAIYTGVDGIKAGVGTATSIDNYASLDKNINNPVIESAPDDVDLDFRDPFVWEEDGIYHMIIGSGISSVGGNVLYYSSEDFENWTYGGIAYQGQRSQGEGEFWEVPVMYRFDNGKEMLLVQKTPDGSSPARTFYWIGQFENGVFTPDFAQSKDLEVVNRFLAPTVTTDTNGDAVAIGIIPDEARPEFQQAQGWANLFSVPQVWELDGNNDIIIKPHPNLESIRGESTSFDPIALSESGSDYLGGFQGRYFEMQATINTGSADQIGFIFGKSPDGEEEYRVYYDMNEQEWVVDSSESSLSTEVRKDVRTGPYSIDPGSTVDLRIYIDGSVLEVFVNGRDHFTGRFFPTLADANGVDLFVTGGSAEAEITIYNLENQ